MHLCENETVDVFETSGNDLATLLRDVADTLDTRGEDNFSLVEVSVNPGYDDDKYAITLFIN